MSFMARMFNMHARKDSGRILSRLDLKKDNIIADIGSGGGYFALEFAKIAKRVYCLDINEKFLVFIKDSAKKQNIKSIQTIKIKENPTIPEKVDLIFLRNVYHHLKDRINYFKKLKDFLRNNGKLIVVERNKDKNKKSHSTEKQIIMDELKNAGYKLNKDFNILPKQNFLIFEI